MLYDRYAIRPNTNAGPSLAAIAAIWKHRIALSADSWIAGITLWRDGDSLLRIRPEFHGKRVLDVGHGRRIGVHHTARDPVKRKSLVNHSTGIAQSGKFRPHCLPD